MFKIKFFNSLKSGVDSIKNRIRNYEIAEKSMAYAHIPSGIAATTLFNSVGWVHDNIGAPIHELLERGAGRDLPEVSGFIGPLGLAIYLGADVGERYYREKADKLKKTAAYVEDYVNQLKAGGQLVGVDEASADVIYWNMLQDAKRKVPERKGIGRIKSAFFKSDEEKIADELWKDKKYYVTDIKERLEAPKRTYEPA